MSSLPPTPNQFSIKTFGCKVNTYDTALIQTQLKEQGYSEIHPQNEQNKKTKPHIHILNTCAVTQKAVDEAKKWVKKYKLHHPESTILVTGCAAQIEGHHLAKLKGVDLVVDNTQKTKLPSLLKSFSTKKLHTSPVFKNRWPIQEKPSLESYHSRLFLKIQDGCNSFCTFCVIPFARGKSRSLSPKDLILAINEHHHIHKVQEVVLTGVHIGDYQMDGKKNGLCGLVKLILENTQIPRIRLSSLEPPELNDELFDIFCSSKRMCPHFHLSVQSLNSKILKLMKRKYSFKEVAHCLEKIQHSLKAFVAMDLITGFPGETKALFEESWLMLKNLPWTKLHVFPYSPRPFTLAGRAKNMLDRGVIRKRSAHLRHLSQHRFLLEAKKQKGSLKRVLPLKKKLLSKKILAISTDYWYIEMREQDSLEQSSELTYRITGFDENSACLKGERVK